MNQWIRVSPIDAVMIVVSVTVVYSMILVYTRIVGLRSFSKISAADFAMTVAVGSLFASTISAPSPTLLMGLLAMAMLFAGQWFFAFLRTRSDLFSRLVNNEPLLLMSAGEFLDDNLRKAKVTRSDVFGKLRAANALDYDQVIAVVFETTGDISVIHSDDPAAKIHPDFIHDVVGHHRLPGGKVRSPR